MRFTILLTPLLISGDLIDKIGRDSGMQAGVYQHRETFELIACLPWYGSQ
ncbi:MAG: hypothetical protein IPI97_13815 [Nitrosomonas sp.]|nr:hypothetical protein [Nitrosomonas sp.]